MDITCTHTAGSETSCNDDKYALWNFEGRLCETDNSPPTFTSASDCCGCGGGDRTGDKLSIDSSARVQISMPVEGDSDDPINQPNYYTLKIKSTRNSDDTEELIARTITVNFAFCDPAWPVSDPGLTYDFLLGETTDDPADGKFKITEFTMDRSGCSLNTLEIRDIDALLGTVNFAKIVGQRKFYFELDSQNLGADEEGQYSLTYEEWSIASDTMNYETTITLNVVQCYPMN